MIGVVGMLLCIVGIDSHYFAESAYKVRRLPRQDCRGVGIKIPAVINGCAIFLLLTCSLYFRCSLVFFCVPKF